MPLCCGKSSDVAADTATRRGRGGRGGANGAAIADDGLHCRGASAVGNPLSSPHTLRAGGAGATAAGPSGPPNATGDARRRVDERLRRSPTLSDLRRDYLETMMELKNDELTLNRSTQPNANKLYGTRSRYGAGSSGSNGASGANGRGTYMIQREHDVTHSESSETMAEMAQRLSGHSLLTSSVPSGISTHGSSTSEGLFTRITRSLRGRERARDILAPPQASESQQGAVETADGCTHSVEHREQAELVRVKLSSSGASHGVQTGQPAAAAQDGSQGSPRSPRRAGGRNLPEVQIARLDDEFYSSQELRQWRRMQMNQLSSFVEDDPVYGSGLGRTSISIEQPHDALYGEGPDARARTTDVRHARQGDEFLLEFSRGERADDVVGDAPASQRFVRIHRLHEGSIDSDANADDMTALEERIHRNQEEGVSQEDGEASDEMVAESSRLMPMLPLPRQLSPSLPHPQSQSSAETRREAENLSSMTMDKVSPRGEPDDADLHIMALVTQR